MKCCYKNCFCEDSDEIVKNGRWNYHPQCLETKNDIAEIAQLFKDKINNNVVFPQLYGAINNIVFKKGITTKFLKFGLEYYINNKIPLNYAMGLHYVVQNKDVQKAWDKAQAIEIKQKMKEEKYPIEENEVSFSYKPIKTKGFGDILGGN